MARKGPTKDPIVLALDEVLSAVQNLFILEALKAGMNVEDIRKILRIDKWRVSNISKHMKEEAKRGNRR